MTETFPVIPFVFSSTDAKIASRFYSDVSAVRIELRSVSRLTKDLNGFDYWIDTGADVLGQSEGQVGPQCSNFLKEHGLDQLIGNERDLVYPKEDQIRSLVFSLLTEASNWDPRMLSVPQVPLVNDGSRNRINRMLAEKTREWVSETGYSGGLILPVIATDREQTRGRTQRTPKVQLIKECYDLSRSRGIWVVDSRLDDQRVAGDHGDWFQGIVDFHQELKDTLPSSCVFFGGPYWALNLVLWAMGAVDFPTISLGTGFKYYLSCGHLTQPRARLAIPPLRRTAVASAEFREWLKRAREIKKQEGDPKAKDLQPLVRKWDRLVLRNQWRMQIAGFYRDWIEDLRREPQSGRSLALYQDLSAAYVFGSALPKLPRDQKGRSREPGRVAELLMLSAL